MSNKEIIQATIPEDLADGHKAILDGCLKLLGENDLKLLLSNDLEDDGIHIMETTTSAPGNGNRFLQDYEMQIMLLEQQNKKRLLMARQDQRGETPFNQVAAARELGRRHHNGTVEISQVEARQMEQPPHDIETLQIQRNMPALGADSANVPVKRRKSDIARRSPSSEMSNDDLIHGSSSSGASAGTLHVSHRCLRGYKIIEPIVANQN